MRGTFKLQGTEKKLKEILTVDYSVHDIDVFSCTFLDVKKTDAFAHISVERDDVEIFGGIIETPITGYGTAGTTKPLQGKDWTALLKHYLTDFQSLVDVSTDAALTAVLSNTGFSHNIDGEIAYISDSIEYDTTCEFLEFDFQGCCIEYLQTAERSSEPDTDVNVLPDPEFRSAFFYDGTTKRQYLFYGTGGTLRYRWTDDCGATWSAEIDTTLSIVGNNFSVAWYDTKVYVFREDGAGNTDFHRGTINDGTGAVTLGLIAGNIFANWMQAGPFFTANGNIWVVENTGGNNDAWESVNDGVAWNNRFTGTEVLMYMLPKLDGEDMWLIEFDAGNTHLELWDWDKSLTTQAFVNLIRNCAGDVIEHVAGCQTANYRIRLAYSDDANELWFRGANTAQTWGTERSVTVGMAALGTQAFHICADRYFYAYVAVMDGAGFRIAKGSETTWSALAAGVAQQGANVSAPASGLWDGEVGCFFSFIGFNDDLWFYLMDPVGIRLDGGTPTGYFVTTTITASGAMVFWGWVTGIGTQTEDMLFSVLKAGDDSVLVDNQGIPFDMRVAGVPETELTIKIRCDMTDTGTDPLLEEFDYSEYVDEVTIDTDFEDAYVGVMKIAALAGAEVWVTYDGTTYTVQFSERRGEDKSNYITLKNGHTSERPDVKPNIKVITKTADWESFSNAIQVLGAGTPGVDRIEEELKDWDSIENLGLTKWAVIRNQDILTDAMARTIAAIELAARNDVVERIDGLILDTYESGAIEIGDFVWVVADFKDAPEEEVNASLRIIRLIRQFSADGGEKVEVEIINRIKTSEYWNYLGKISDLERWI